MSNTRSKSWKDRWCKAEIYKKYRHKHSQTKLCYCGFHHNTNSKPKWKKWRRIGD